MLVDGPDPSTTHLESLSLEFNFSRRIETELPLWLLTPTKWYPSNMSGSFSLESRIVDIEAGVVLLNFTRLRNLEMPPMSPVRWSSISFQFLMTPESPESAESHFDAFTLEISFTLHRVPGEGKVMYERGTTGALNFQPPAGSASSTSWCRNLLAPQSRDAHPAAAIFSIHFCA
jgi:hypothetical protein